MCQGYGHVRLKGGQSRHTLVASAWNNDSLLWHCCRLKITDCGRATVGSTGSGSAFLSIIVAEKIWTRGLDAGWGPPKARV